LNISPPENNWKGGDEEMQREKIKQVIDDFPEEVDMDAFMEKLYLLDKIEQGEKQLAEGKGISHDEVKERLKKWLK
jgi:hypothetical protein